MSVSTVPLPPAFFHPILKSLRGQPSGIRRRDLHEPVADLLVLTPEQRQELLPSGAHFRYRHRLGWGLNMLKNAGYIEAPSLGLWRITPDGIRLIEANPDSFDEEIMKRIVREAQLGPEAGGGQTDTDETADNLEQTPEERIDAATREIQSATAKALLQRISQASPEFFETLVLELLHAMGYGGSEGDVQHLGRSGDEGIDGVISLDKLGLEKVYVQAKRWQGSVGRPELQGFYGALAGRRARKGVFITTSSFTREAREFGTQVAESIVLIDGAHLANLMSEYGIGVSHKILRLPRVDADYFSDD